MGKAMLAFLPEDGGRGSSTRCELSQRGPNTITDEAAFRAELAGVRRRGIAVNDEELAYGLRSIAAPMRGASGEVVAALNLAVHRSMVSIDDLIVRLGPAVDAQRQ